MKRTTKHLLGSLALVALATPLSGFAETVYQPANFAFHGAQLAALVSGTSTVAAPVLYCQSEISVAGAAENTSCYDAKGDRNLERLTEKALATLPFSAAKVDGQAVRVRMSYRVVYSAEQQKLAATLIPNLGSMQERYGRDYIAPQERLDVSDWYDRYSKDSWVSGKAFLGEGDLSRVAATVDEQGRPASVRTVDTERGYKRDANIVKNALKKSRFIPGFVRGKPVPMGYLAVVNYGEGEAAVANK